MSCWSIIRCSFLKPSSRSIIGSGGSNKHWRRSIDDDAGATREHRIVNHNRDHDLTVSPPPRLQNPTTTTTTGTTTLVTQQSIVTSTNAAGSPTTATVFQIQIIAPVSSPALSMSSPNIAAIAGGAAGGAVVFLILAFLLWRCCRTRNTDNQVQDSITPIAEVYEPTARDQAEMKEPSMRSSGK